MIRLLRITLLFALLNIISMAYAQTKPSFPKEWRPASKSDYSEEDLSFMNHRVPNNVHADFNGDGLEDSAWILVKDIEKKWELFVFVGKKADEYELIKLDENKMTTDKLHMGLSRIPKGKHKTACGKGYWDCSAGEPEILNLKNPGIDYFVFESANSVFYWDNHIKGFKRIWLSD